MAKRKKSASPDPIEDVAAFAVTETQVSTSALSLHELFEQQTHDMLARADITEDERQSVLIALSCPCCGAGGMNYTFKLKS